MERTCATCGEVETKEIPKKVRPSDKPNPGVTDILPEYYEESNPSTGAPVFDMTFAGFVILAATAIVLEKKNK